MPSGRTPEGRSEPAQDRASGRAFGSHEAQGKADQFIFAGFDGAEIEIFDNPDAGGEELAMGLRTVRDESTH